MTNVVAFAAMAMALVLALRSFRAHELSFGQKIAMAAVWAIVIGLLAFVLSDVST